MSSTTTTRERPILFSAPMVRANLEGRKTQTRRLVKTQAELQFLGAKGDDKADPRWWGWENEDGEFCSLAYNPEVDHYATCPYGQPGDTLWVRENWRISDRYDTTPLCMVPDTGRQRVWYAADGSSEPSARIPGKARSSIHMPRWASRITLEVENVRVQRVGQITDADAVAEGIVHRGKKPEWNEWGLPDSGWVAISPRRAFLHLFYEINKRAPAAESPWVWAITFKRVKP